MALTSQEQKKGEHGMQHFSDLSSSMRLMSSKSRSSTVCNNSKATVIAKRRSRASKKTPITLLNTNASNFRALVQQFTGCPTTPLSLGVPFKGPITLNFQRGIREMQIHHHNNTTTPTSSQDHHNNNNNNNNQVLHVRLHQNQNQHQQIIQLSQVSDHHHQEQQVINVDDDDCVMMIMEKTSNTTGDSSSSAVSNSSSSSGLEVSHHHHHLTDDFDGFMDDFSLHDLIDMNNAFSNDLGYFV